MEPFDNYPAPPPRAAGPTSAQKALAVVAVMLGVMGVMGGCCGAVSNMASGAMLDAQGELLGAEGMPGAEQQRAIIAASREIADKYMPFLVLVQLLNVVASLLLLVAGVFTLTVRERASTLMLVGCGANGFVDIGLASVTLLQQLETQRVMSGAILPPGSDPNLGRVMETSMQAGMFVGVCFVAGWLLVKLVFYITSSVVMRGAQA
jgi:hypothetical protein